MFEKLKEQVLEFINNPHSPRPLFVISLDSFRISDSPITEVGKDCT